MKKIRLLQLFFIGIVLGLTAAVIAQKNDKKKDPVKIFKKYGCIECHSISALGIGTSGDSVKTNADGEDDESEAIEPPDLSDVGSRYDAKWISGYLRKKKTIDGRKHKKRFKGKAEERQALSIWLASLKGESDKKADSTKTESDKN